MSNLEKLLQDTLAQAQASDASVVKFALKVDRIARHAKIFGLVILLGILSALLLTATSKESANQAAEAAAKSQEAVTLIQDCVTPSGKCYTDLRAGNVDFRQSLLGAIAILTDCDVSTDDLGKFRRCVKNRTLLDSSKTLKQVVPESVIAPEGRSGIAPRASR